MVEPSENSGEIAVARSRGSDWKATRAPFGDHRGADPKFEICLGAPPATPITQMPPREGE
jgi:hypothetical protein